MDHGSVDDRAVANWAMDDRSVDDWAVTAECRSVRSRMGRRVPAAFSVLLMLSQSQARGRE
jgi:hypothetical protein